jgi:N6-adenosine-specific RNA methylase IME4
MTATATKYGTIIMDPPWRYGGTGQFQGRGRKGQVQGRFNGGQRFRYPSMHTDEIAALPIAALAADECVLLMWATWPMLPDALYCVKQYGFEYVTGLPWIKVLGPSKPFTPQSWRERLTLQYGIGFWVRSCSEPLLIARRGDVTIRSPFVGLLSPNLGHSRKPDSAYEYAAQFAGPRLELFARRPYPGWDALGNEITGRPIAADLAALAAD